MTVTKSMSMTIIKIVSDVALQKNYKYSSCSIKNRAVSVLLFWVMHYSHCVCLVLCVCKIATIFDA